MVYYNTKPFLLCPELNGINAKVSSVSIPQTHAESYVALYMVHNVCINRIYTIAVTCGHVQGGFPPQDGHMVDRKA